MKSFILSNPNIEKIELACLVKSGTGNNRHIDRPTHGIALFPDGERCFSFSDGEKFTVGGNALVYFPKGSSYTIRSIKQADCYAINFEISDTSVFKPFTLEIQDSGKYLSGFISAVKCWNTKQNGFELKVKSELYGIIYQMQNEYIGNTYKSCDLKLKPALDYIRSELSSGDIYVSKLAELCEVSEVYLRKLFLKRFSVTPSTYIKNLRLEKAQQLLLSGLYTCSEVCYMSGFTDESYFSREFKKKNGFTPGQYKSINGL